MTPLDEATVWIEITTDMKDARGLTVSDFIISGGCIGALHVITENRIWRLEISIAENTKGFLTVAIPSNVVSEGNDPVSKSFEFDRTPESLSPPYLQATGVPSTATGATFSFTVTSYAGDTETNIDELLPEDFLITSPEGNLTPTIT